MKKICHVVDRLNVGGLEKTLVQIVSGLKEYKHHVWCLDSKGPLAETMQSQSIEVREFGFKGGIRFSTLKLLTSAMREEKFDILHTHGLYPSIWARLAAVAARVPVIIEHVQTMYTQVPFIDKLKLLALEFPTTKIIAVAEAVKRSTIMEIKAPEAKIVVIYNSSDDMKAAATDARQDIRRELGLGGSFTVGAVGRLEKIKGYNFLIDAMKICRDYGLDVKCIIVGPGLEESELRKQIADLRLEDHISLLGFRSDIARVLSGIDVLIQPSTLIEGLPLVLAEAASAGLPLIATSVGGNAEIVEDGKNGYVVPPMDASAIAGKITFLARHGDEAKRMGENSRSIWQEKFTRDRMLQKLDELYKRCAQGRDEMKKVADNGV